MTASEADQRGRSQSDVDARLDRNSNDIILVLPAVVKFYRNDHDQEDIWNRQPVLPLVEKDLIGMGLEIDPFPVWADDHEIEIAVRHSLATVCDP